MPDYILTATISKLKMAAGYYVDSDGYPASYEFIYIKLQVCEFWCFYHKMHNPTKKLSLAAVLLTSNLLCFFTSVKLCPLVILLSFISKKY